MKFVKFISLLTLVIFTCYLIARNKKIVIPTLPGMVYIPPDEIIFGSDTGYVYEAPKQKVFVSGFFIDKTEVTNKQYKRFIDDTGHTPPPHWKNGVYLEGTDNFPVVNVSLEDAQKYAKWSGKRLPTELEWEKAARGTDGRTFPWGEIWESGYANTSWFLSFGTIKPVATYKTDISPYGCYDMAGNVREWTQSKFVPYSGYIGDKKYFKPEFYVVRGGSYKLQKTFCYTYRRDAYHKDTKLPDLGFRCVKDIVKIR